MAHKRRKYAHRRRRLTIRRGRRGRGRRNFTPRIYKFTRVCQISATTVVDALQNLAFSFRLDQLPSYAEFTSLFDQYRIRGVRLWGLLTRYNVNTASGAIGTVPIRTQFLTVSDYDDGTPLAATTDYYQYSNVRASTRAPKRFIRPRPAAAMYGGAFSKFASVNNRVWIDSANPDVLYYGVKIGMDSGTEGGIGGTTIGRIVWYAKFYIECKNVH